jgi:hypothetical protein
MRGLSDQRGDFVAQRVDVLRFEADVAFAHDTVLVDQV